MEEKEFAWNDELIKEFTRERTRSAFKATIGVENKNDLWVNFDLVTEVLIQDFKQSKQKQYPPGIISFRYENTIVTKGDDINYRDFASLNKLRDYKIHSVQNGDEILTVGDKIIDNNFEVSEICSFHIDDNYGLCLSHTTMSKLVNKYKGGVGSVGMFKKLAIGKSYTASEVQELFKKFLETLHNEK